MDATPLDYNYKVKPSAGLLQEGRSSLFMFYHRVNPTFPEHRRRAGVDQGWRPRWMISRTTGVNELAFVWVSFQPVEATSQVGLEDADVCCLNRDTPPRPPKRTVDQNSLVGRSFQKLRNSIHAIRMFLNMYGPYIHNRPTVNMTVCPGAGWRGPGAEPGAWTEGDIGEY